jgi:hypothetical protein
MYVLGFLRKFHYDLFRFSFCLLLILLEDIEWAIIFLGMSFIRFPMTIYNSCCPITGNVRYEKTKTRNNSHSKLCSRNFFFSLSLSRLLLLFFNCCYCCCCLLLYYYFDRLISYVGLVACTHAYQQR